MADVFDAENRSSIVAKIKFSNTKPEMLVRKLLFANGCSYRINDVYLWMLLALT